MKGKGLLHFQPFTHSSGTPSRPRKKLSKGTDSAQSLKKWVCEFRAVYWLGGGLIIPGFLCEVGSLVNHNYLTN
jgi:hypothetical protein